MSIYQDNGYSTRIEYIIYLQKSYNFDIKLIKLLSDQLGHDEDFTGLIFILDQMDGILEN